MSFYRGGVGQWSWALHRLTGVGVALFLAVHILDTALVLAGPSLYNRVMAVYRLPLFGLSEIGLFAAVLYHALNGIRIIVIDFWPAGALHHKGMFYAVAVVFALIFLPVAAIMLGHILQGGHG